MPDSFGNAVHFQCADPWQCDLASVSIDAVHFRFAVFGDFDFEQSTESRAGDAVGVFDDFAQHFFLGIYFPARNDAVVFSYVKLFCAGDVFY